MKRFAGVNGKAWTFILGTLSTLIILGCSGGSGGSHGDGNSQISFRAHWERGARSGSGIDRTGVDDCIDVETVGAAVLTETEILQEGGPWICSAGEGLISGVPAGYTVWLAVVGYGANGRVLYRGESGERFLLRAGETYDAGLISAASFVPVLSAPAAGAFVPPPVLDLRWNPVNGASRYLVTLYSDSDFMTAVRSVSVAAAAAPSYRPEGLNTGVPYYWRVQAIDTAENIGEFSEGRSFTLSSETLSVNITSPTDGALIQFFEPVNFSATVMDSDGNPLMESDLASIVWRSNVDGVFGSSLDFDFIELTIGAIHVITLEVTAINGLNGMATVTIETM